MASPVADKNSVDTSTEVDLSREVLYRFLAMALRNPALPGGHLLIDPESQRLCCEAIELLQAHGSNVAIPLGFGELPVEDLSLRAAMAELGRSAPERQAEFVRVFGLAACRECPPYETDYHREAEVFFRSQQMADVAGFYLAFGLTPGGGSRERPDHLALQLEFVSCLLMKLRLVARELDELVPLNLGPPAAEASVAREQIEIARQALDQFFRDHLCWWVPSFSLALRRKAEHGFYAGVGRVLGALMPLERHRLGIAPPAIPLEAESIELPIDSPEQCAGCLALDAKSAGA